MLTEWFGRNISKLRILIISQYFWPEDFRINETISFFTSRKHEVSVLTGKPNYPEGKIFSEYSSNPEKYNFYHGAEIIRLPILSRGNSKVKLFLNYLSFVLLGSLLGPVKLRGRTFDIIFVYEPSPITVGLPAIVISRIKKLPIVFWALDLWPETLQALKIVKSKFLVTIFKKLAKFIYSNCTLVLGQSKSFVKNISKYIEDPEKVKFFPSWCEDMEISDATPLASEISTSKDHFNILFTGNIAEAQDMPRVLDAIEISKKKTNLRWYFIGDGRKLNWLKRSIDSRNLQDKVFLLGRFPAERMPEFFKHADALLVSLQQSDAFSMVIPAKIQTYLKAGIPIIGMLDGDGKEIIDKSLAGMTCSAGNSHALASIFIRISELGTHERKLMGKNGKKFAKENFDKELLLENLENHFRRSIEKYNE